ncbi:MAG: GNAT family N-acetyltransferase [Burkholderiales bacterium]|nr:GNAT family N-acetyltransferase [Burkholderiales bacterium]
MPAELSSLRNFHVASDAARRAEVVTGTTRPAADFEWQLLAPGSFSARHAEWDAFNDALWNTPLLSASFVGAALDHFGDGSERLAVARDVDGVVAMTVLTKGERLALKAFQASQLPLCPWMQRPGRSLDTLGRALLACTPPWKRVLSLSPLDPAKLPRIQDNGLIHTSRYIDTGRIELPGDLATFESGLSAKFRANLMRRHRAASATFGDVTLEVETRPERMQACIDQYAHLEGAGWKADAGTAVRAGEAQFDFYVDMLTRLAQKEQALVFLLRFGARVAAMQLAVARDSRLYFLKTTYDEGLGAHGPGVLLKWKLFEAVLTGQLPFRRCDLYGRVNDSNRNWVTTGRSLYHANIYRGPSTAALHLISRAFRSGSVAPADDAAMSLTDSGADRTADPTGDQPIPQDAYALSAKLPLFHCAEWFDLLVRTALPAGERPTFINATTSAPRMGLVVPLVKCGQGRFRSLTNFYSPTYAPICDTAAGMAAAQALAAFAADPHNGVDILELLPLGENQEFERETTSALRAAGFQTDRFFCFANWYLEVGGRSFAEFFAGLPSVIRKNAPRYRRRLEEKGMRIEIVRAATQRLDEAVASFEHIYLNSWRAKSEPFPAFIGELCRMGASRGWLRLGLLFLDGTPVAAQIWLVKNGVASIFKLAYLEAFAKLSVGTVLTAEMMRLVIDEDKVSVVDYLSGDDAYKRDWMSHRRERYGLIAFNLRRPRGWYGAAMHYCGGLAKDLRGRLRGAWRKAAPTRA